MYGVYMYTKLFEENRSDGKQKEKINKKKKEKSK